MEQEPIENMEGGLSTAKSMESASGERASATLRDYVELLRPTHWVKNVVVFAGPAAALKLSSAVSLAQTAVAFGAFCLVASANYAINDALDREADARHPTKRNRPVARGAITPAAASALAVLLVIVAATATTLALNVRVTGVLLLYCVIVLAYSIKLKQRVILDVIILAMGFVLRAWAGSLAVGVATSEWLVACVFTLCLFMGFGKRRCELAMIGDVNEAAQHRRTLVRYTPDLLNHLITVSAGIAVITFLLYTLDTSGHPAPFHKQHLFYTLPVVIYGIFRFAMVTELGVYGGPTEIVLKDKGLRAAIVLWAVAALGIAYEVPLFGAGALERLLGPL